MEPVSSWSRAVDAVNKTAAACECMNQRSRRVWVEQRSRRCQRAVDVVNEVSASDMHAEPVRCRVRRSRANGAAALSDVADD